MWKHICFALLVGLAACGKPEEKVIGGADFKEPDFVTVDHILISMRGTGTNATRSPDAAKKLAYDLLKKLEDGGDWAKLKQQYSDDKQQGIAGGPYSMTNHGVARRPGVTPRGNMVSAFGDVGFRLNVGQMRIADYDPVKSKFGYHIIKRVR